jgi:hypothetical protein
MRVNWWRYREADEVRFGTEESQANDATEREAGQSESCRE